MTLRGQDESEKDRLRRRRGTYHMLVTMDLDAPDETMLITQMFAVHHAVMECPRGAPGRPKRLWGAAYPARSTISFLISAIAFAGFRPFGQLSVQFMMVWQRYSSNGSSSASNRAPVASSRVSAIQR